MIMNNNLKILLIISGGIAAYKSLELIRIFKKNNIKVQVVLTKGGAEFVTPLSIAALSEEKVYQELFSLKNETEMGHIQLSRESDLILVAPASANIIAHAAAGIANDLATTILLAANKPIIIIGDKGSELDLMIQEFPAIGWFCEADSSEKLAKLIDSISLQASQEKAYQPRDVIRNKYDYALIRKDYLRHYIRIKELVL